MTEQEGLKKGWEFTAQNMGVSHSVLKADAYVGRVDDAIKQLEKDINAKQGTAEKVGSLKGFIAEYFHADTFNIDAALKDSASRAKIEKSNAHASVDVSTNFGKDYSMKYYRNADESAKQQAKNVIQAYHDYLRNPRTTKAPMTFEEYIKKYGYSDDMNDLLLSVYRNQYRVIPSDQLKEAQKKLRDWIATESKKTTPNREAVLRNYEETLEKLRDRIEDGKGVASTPLTKEESEVIAALAKEGLFKAEDFGFSLEDLITKEYIMQQALKAGYTSAVITLVFQLAPEIYKAIDYLIKTGEIDVEQLKNIGKKGLSAGAESFIKGSISSSLTIACEAGKLGASFKNLQPQTIGAVTLIALDSVKYSIFVAAGKMSAQEMGSQLTKEVIISSASIVGGNIAQSLLPQLPVLGYMLGSFVGSVVATVTLNIGEKYLISFCIDTGFTCFGLVTQDYTLPQEVLDEMGINTIPLKRTEVKRSEIKRVEIARTEVKRIQLETIDIRILERGLIGVNKIGYV